MSVCTLCVGLSFYNNHVDANAKFTSFAVDGESTSRGNTWAVGEKGKGFILATQFFKETVDACDQKRDAGPQTLKTGVSFRVGHQIGELAWRESNEPSGTAQLRVTLDDLTPVDAEGLLRRRELTKGDDEDDERPVRKSRPSAPKANTSSELKAIYKRRLSQKLAVSDEADDDASDPMHQTSCVSADELCVTVLGLDPTLTPAQVFQGVFGIIKPHQMWRVPNHPVTFFKTGGPVRFYLRDQIVPNGARLNTVGINYHGNLKITADRRSIIEYDSTFRVFKYELGKAADAGFLSDPNLAVELAYDILTDMSPGHASLAIVLKPAGGPGSKEAYARAFTAAWRRILPALDVQTPWPYTQFSKDLPFIQELGMQGRLVSEYVMRLLVSSGAYKPIEEHMQSLLLDAPIYTVRTIPGFDRFQRGVHNLIPNIPVDRIFVHNYTRSHPKVIWDKTGNRLVIRVPGTCSEHGEGVCLCWIGPFLGEVWEEWSKKENISSEQKAIGMARIYRVFLACMEGVTPDMRAADSDSEDEDDEPPPPKEMTFEQVMEAARAIFDKKVAQIDEKTKELDDLEKAQAEKLRIFEAKQKAIQGELEDTRKLLKVKWEEEGESLTQIATPSPSPSKKRRKGD